MVTTDNYNYPLFISMTLNYNLNSLIIKPISLPKSKIYILLF